MLIRIGYRIRVECAAATPLLLMLRVRPERALVGDDRPGFAPAVPWREHLDSFGNRCMRVVAPPGGLHFSASALVRDSGAHDPVEPTAGEQALQDLPPETLGFLLPSRYCESDLLAAEAWRRFGAVTPGWSRVQAVCDHVHGLIRFDYNLARNDRTAAGAAQERVGVCRDYAHLAVAFCRALNIPARYVTGYLGDIGVPVMPYPMDFSAWIEVWLGQRWYAFDPRHNVPRIGRVPVAWGRDAADVAMVTSFGAHTLSQFEVVTEEVAGARSAA